MKEKIRIKVLLPATQKMYEFRMPFDITVEEGAHLISYILASREPMKYEANNDVDLVVIDKDEKRELLNPKETFRSLIINERIVEGSSLMLV